MQHRVVAAAGCEHEDHPTDYPIRQCFRHRRRATFIFHVAGVRNVTNDNAGHGLSIVDTIDTHGPLHTIEDHVANANGGLGITSNVLGVVTLGKLRAHANGDPRQCVNVACR